MMPLGPREAYASCDNCRQPVLKRKALGINGKWLCSECCRNVDVLNRYMAQAIRPARKLLG